MRHVPTQKSWSMMIRRCTSPAHDKYAYYGGRGIKVCPQWMNYDQFVSDMGERPDGTSLDRINSNGNYEPGNCRWADKMVQASNKSNNRIVVLNGERLHISEAARRVGIRMATIWARLDKGWTDEQALHTPILKNGFDVNAPKQQRNGNTKINAEQRLEILNSVETRSQLAKKYNVSKSTIDSVKDKRRMIDRATK